MLAVAIGLLAAVVGVLAFIVAGDAFDANVHAGCPPEDWSQALLAESRVIAGITSESAGSYGDCDASGATYLARRHPDAAGLPRCRGH